MDARLYGLIIKSPVKFYQTKEWELTRDEIMARDHNECQHCKAKSPSKYARAMLVHHKKELKGAPFLALSPGNLESLCFSCHEEAHGRCFVGNMSKKKFFSEERW